METLKLDTDSKDLIVMYRNTGHIVRYENSILDEMLEAIEQNDIEKINWFNSFGDSVRAITMNINAYRKGLEFGFTEIAFDQYGWFKRPVWLDTEEFTFGDTSRYRNYSTITIGHGPNGLWTYAMSYSFGCAGGGYALSVFDKSFNSRNIAFDSALIELKTKMHSRLGSTDTTNDKQSVLVSTLRDIANAQMNIAQLSMF